MYSHNFHVSYQARDPIGARITLMQVAYFAINYTILLQMFFHGTWLASINILLMLHS